MPILLMKCCASTSFDVATELAFNDRQPFVDDLLPLPTGINPCGEHVEGRQAEERDEEKRYARPDLYELEIRFSVDPRRHLPTDCEGKAEDEEHDCTDRAPEVLKREVLLITRKKRWGPVSRFAILPIPQEHCGAKHQPSQNQAHRSSRIVMRRHRLNPARKILEVPSA